jgi:hypothetical protein
MAAVHVQTHTPSLQFKGDITELEELRELKEDVTRQQQAQATLIQSQACNVEGNMQYVLEVMRAPGAAEAGIEDALLNVCRPSAWMSLTACTATRRSPARRPTMPWRTSRWVDTTVLLCHFTEDCCAHLLQITL